MDLYAPDYYKKFSCIADKCKHNCCIGWEIDIDDDTYEYYKLKGGSFAKRFKENVEIENGVPHFKLTKEERCPFLNKNNLCDIILELGENSLCQICTDHPRFRNYFCDRTELGIGLCCEEAAKIIITNKEKVHIEKIDEDDEPVFLYGENESFYKLRQGIFDVLQNRELPFFKRVENLFEMLDIKFPQKPVSEWADIFLGLERLDEEWTKRLINLKGTVFLLQNTSEWIEKPLEQLAVYFVFRHFSDALDDGLYRERIAFCILSVFMIYNLFLSSVGKLQSENFDELIEISRLYSSEIEYCEENTEKLKLQFVGELSQGSALHPQSFEKD